jgi:hypothetical protein
LRPIDAVLDKLPGVKKQGAGFVARCPAHDDDHQSLSVGVGDEDRVIVKCHAGCELDAILTAAGLSVGDLFASEKRQRDAVVAEYEYRDETGKLLFVVERRSPKNFLQKKPAPGGGWEYRLNGVRRVPFRLPELLEGVARNRWCVIVEGEKDALALVERGFVATTNAAGAGKWRDEFGPFFAGAKVAVIGDNDKAGRAHVEQVCEALSCIASTVRVVQLPDLPEHGDPFDWFAAGGETSELRRLIEGAPEWEPADKVSTAVDTSELAAAELPDEDGAPLLDDVAEFIARFVACTDAAIDMATLWAAHTWALDAFDVSPRLFASSQEPGSGKTRTLEVLKVLVRAPLFMANVSESYLFRRVDAERCTVLHDEIDTVFGKKARDREELRAMLNAGWERGAVVGRMVGEGSKMRPQDFQVFAPVAMAGLGRLPETIEQRAWRFRLKRRRPGEQVAKFRRREIGPEAERLRDRLSAWCTRRLADLEQARPALPDELSDRAQDAAEPLLALADAAGGDWPRRARRAVVELSLSRDASEGTIGVRLLADVRAVFDDPGVSKIADSDKGDGLSSGDLAAALAAIEGAPWPEWGRKEKPITATALARMLKPYDVAPAQHKMAGVNMRGYLRTDFADAWERNLAPLVPPETSVTGDKLLPPAPALGLAGNTSGPVTLCTRGTQPLDSDDPEYGYKLALARAAEVQQRRARAAEAAE